VLLIYLVVINKIKERYMKRITLFIITIIAIAIFALPNVGVSTTQIAVEMSEPECICAEFRIAGVCSGATTRFCQGIAACKDICG
jgi:hypothetical protein